MAEWKVLSDAVGIRGIHDGRLAQPAAALRTLALKQVPAASLHPHNFAGAGDLEPLGNGFFRFDAFGTTHKLSFL